MANSLKENRNNGLEKKSIKNKLDEKKTWQTSRGD